MKLTDVICCTVLAVGLASSGAAVSAQIEGKPFHPNAVPHIMFSGQIVPEDVAKFQSVAEAVMRDQKAHGQSPPISVLLDSPGGDARAAMAIGRYMRANDMWTRVQFTCISSCIFMHTAGVSRNVDYGGATKTRVGIHRPFYTETKMLSAREADAMHKQMDVTIRVYFKEMNIPDALTDAMLRVPPENVRYLASDELEEYGLEGEDPGYAQRYAIREAKDYGLTMSEYYARVGRRDEQCARRVDITDITGFYCGKAVMYGISVAEAKRRLDNTRVCGEADGLTSAEKKRRSECLSAVMRGERSLTAQTPTPAAAQKGKEFLADASAKIEAVHPGWTAIVRTAEFQAWKASSPVYERLAASDDVNDAIALLYLYKAHQNQASVSPPVIKQPAR